MFIYNHVYYRPGKLIPNGTWIIDHLRYLHEKSLYGDALCNLIGKLKKWINVHGTFVWMK